MLILLTTVFLVVRQYSLTSLTRERQEKLFNIRNVKKLIDVWLLSNQLDNPDITINYQQSGRKWVVSKN